MERQMDQRRIHWKGKAAKTAAAAVYVHFFYASFFSYRFG